MIKMPLRTHLEPELENTRKKMLWYDDPKFHSFSRNLHTVSGKHQELSSPD